MALSIEEIYSSLPIKNISCPAITNSPAYLPYIPNYKTSSQRPFETNYYTSGDEAIIHSDPEVERKKTTSSV